MASSALNHSIVNVQAEIHKLKSEYVKARSIHAGILQELSVDQDPYAHATTLVNIAEIDVSVNAPMHDVQRSCDTARKIFNTTGLVAEVIICDIILADLHLREEDFLQAKTLFERCIRLSLASELTSYCLERLGNVRRWGALSEMSSWTTVFLVHSVKRKERVGIHKALQFLGDVFLALDDEHTAISLFTVALEGFTQMDVHCSRAECMLLLGDIFQGHGNLLKAVELWETARPLFEQSSQAKQIEQIDEKLLDINKDVLKQHGTNFAFLAEPHPTSGALKTDKVTNLLE